MDLDKVALFKSSPFSEESKAKCLAGAASKIKRLPKDQGAYTNPNATPWDKKRRKLNLTTPGDTTPTKEKIPGPIIITPSKAKKTGKRNHLLLYPSAPPEGERAMCHAALRHNIGGCNTVNCDKNHDPPLLWSDEM